jgi:hypothetical protein
MSDQTITEGATYITHEKGMPSVEFEPGTLRIVRQQAYALDTMATGIGLFYIRRDWWYGFFVLRSSLSFPSEKLHNVPVLLLCTFGNFAA